MITYESLAITRWPKTLPRWQGPLQLSHNTIAYQGALHLEIGSEQARTWKELMGAPDYREMVSSGNLIIKTIATQKPASIYNNPLIAHVSLMLADFYYEAEGKLFLTDFQIQNDNKTIISQATRKTSGPSFYLERSDEDGLHDWIQQSSTVLNRWPIVFDKLLKILIPLRGKDGNQLTEALSCFIEAHKAYNLSYKIPLLVRTFECLADCWKEQQFIQAVLHYTPVPNPQMPKSKYFTSDFIERLYRLRNKLTHGHTFKQATEELGLEPAIEQSRMEFLAEYIARESIVKAIVEYDSSSFLASREALKKHWKTFYETQKQ